MKCDEIQEMLLDAASGTGATTPVLNEHLRGCATCANKFAGMQETMALLDEWQAPEPSPYFDTRFAARMREERAKPQRATWLAWFRAPALAGALALVLMVAGGVNWFNARNGGQKVANDHPQSGIEAVPGTAVGDLQALDNNEDVYANFDVLDDLQSPDADADQTENP
jgi:predicted anti-sigma-YlaC factor YlaD